MNSSFLSQRKKAFCLIFLAILFFGAEDSWSLFGNPARSTAGRPRFKKGERKLFYFGIGIGMNAYDHISCETCIGFSDSINKGLAGTMNGFPSNVNFIGFPVLFFGFVPSYARFMRHHFEASIKFASLSVNTTPTHPLTIGSDHYTDVDFSTINFRAMYELFFQTKPLFGRLLLFMGGGLGLSVNNASLSATSLDTSTTPPASGTSVTLANVTNASITFAPSVGALFDISETFALELKTRYFFIMTPFGQSESFGIYRQGFEIIGSILLRF